MRITCAFCLLPALLLASTGCATSTDEDPPPIEDSTSGDPPSEPDPPPAPKLPPNIIATKQSSLSAMAGEEVSFEVEASDPQNSPLTFAWTSNLGALGTAQSGATTSLVPWVAPPCISSGLDPSITVTATNEFMLSASATFTVGGVLPCTMEPDGGTIYSDGGQVETVVVPPGKSTVFFLLWGAGGGGGAPAKGGGGGFVHAQFPVVEGDQLEIRVASGGAAYGGGGGASYVRRNGEVMLVAAGGGGAGVDGCSGCSSEGGTHSLAGGGGAGGPAGGEGEGGQPNDHWQTNSGPGSGGTPNAGGAGGISNDQNPFGFDTCTANGLPGSQDQGGAAYSCSGGNAKPAAGHLGGEGVGNGSGGGGGSGKFGGGGGALKWTYTGGGGGGGASWLHASATLLGTEGGSGQAPGGAMAPGYQGDAGLGGEPQTDPFGAQPTPGKAGLIIMKL